MFLTSNLQLYLLLTDLPTYSPQRRPEMVGKRSRQGKASAMSALVFVNAKTLAERREESERLRLTSDPNFVFLLSISLKFEEVECVCRFRVCCRTPIWGEGEANLTRRCAIVMQRKCLGKTITIASAFVRMFEPIFESITHVNETILHLCSLYSYFFMLIWNYFSNIFVWPSTQYKKKSKKVMICF